MGTMLLSRSGAALLVDHVLPAVGYRQWVLSFEGPLAVRLGYDRALLAKVAERLARAVMQDMRWSAKERHGLATVESLHAGVLMVVQRFRSDLGLFVHLHALVTDGAFEERGGEVRFMPASTPTPERLTAVLAQVHKAGAAVTRDDDLDMEPTLAACVQLGLLARVFAVDARGSAARARGGARAPWRRRAMSSGAVTTSRTRMRRPHLRQTVTSTAKTRAGSGLDDAAWGRGDRRRAGAALDRTRSPRSGHHDSSIATRSCKRSSLSVCWRAYRPRSPFSDPSICCSLGG